MKRAYAMLTDDGGIVRSLTDILTNASLAATTINVVCRMRNVPIPANKHVFLFSRFCRQKNFFFCLAINENDVDADDGI